MITVRVEAEPSTAVIKLGGLEVHGNPVEKGYLRTDEPLAISVEAKGYVTYREVLRRTEDIDLRVKLEPVAHGKGAGGAKVTKQGGAWNFGVE